MDYYLLTGCRLFKGLDAESIDHLLANKHYQIKKYRKGSIIAFSGEVADRLCIILKGSVRGEMTDFSGKTIKIEDRQAPEPIATAFIFGKNNKFPVNVISSSDTEILMIPKETLTGMLQENLQFLNNFLNAVSGRAQFLSHKIRFLSFKTIKGKFAQFLLQNGANEKDVISIPKTITELAELFGVTRPSLSRAISEMEQGKAIRMEKKNIHILDRDKLNAFLD
jgi:CRP/FNR family transcriptional regulator, dissimilatory nitrate respiration regulator